MKRTECLTMHPVRAEMPDLRRKSGPPRHTEGNITIRPVTLQL
jgi:hypothetical protein